MFPNEYPNLFFVPYIPSVDMRPPTLYAILESVVNFDKEIPTRIKDLAKEGRTKIFDFDYPLSNYISKEDFETIILNKFLMRRIGFETVMAFKIQLNVKLNEIMPMYNKLIDLLYSENGFEEITNRSGFDNRIVDNTSNTTNSMTNTSNTTHESTSDRRRSNTPQNELDNVRAGKYVTDYSYDTDNSTNEDTSETNGESQNISNTTDNNNYEENINKKNNFEIYLKLNEEIKNIYTMIFKDLDSLFYQLV